MNSNATTRPSDIVWNQLEGACRGEASEMFADVIFAVLGDEEDSSGNGSTIDALEAALNALCKDPKKLEALNKWVEEEEEDEQ